jgi:hypothetical protein
VFLTCEHAAKQMGLDLSCWREASKIESNLLAEPTFDDEGAESCFLNRSWREVSVVCVLEHPTASNFLSDKAFVIYSPAIIAACLWGYLKNKPQNLKSQWGVKIESAKEQSLVVLDHYFADLARRVDKRSFELSSKQWNTIVDVATKTENAETIDEICRKYERKKGDATQ